MKGKRTLSIISRIREAANKFIVDELKKAGISDIVPSHGDILMSLYRNNNQPISMKEISRKIRRTQPTVTVLIDKLIDYGYVKKDKNQQDGRTTDISLTPQGENFKSIFLDIAARMNEKMFQGFSEEDIDLTEKLLSKIEKNW